MTLEVVPLSQDRRRDFWSIHAPQHGEGWCCCVAWWVPTWEGWGERAAIENRRLREELFDRGELDLYLLLEDGAPVGSCQCGPRDRLAKLVAQYRLAPDPEVWALSCFVLAPSARGRGLARTFLAGILDDLARRGVRHVQAFPKRGTGLEAGEVWTGPEALFRGAGFTVERDDPARPVYGVRLA